MERSRHARLAFSPHTRYVRVMVEEPENLTLRILQEMRDEIRSKLSKIDEKLSEIDENITDLTQRVDGNTIVFNLVAGVVYDHEHRIDNLGQR